MNHTSSYHAQGPQRRERLLDLASLRKAPAPSEALEAATEPLASSADAEKTNMDPADAE